VGSKEGWTEDRGVGWTVDRGVGWAVGSDVGLAEGSVEGLAWGLKERLETNRLENRLDCNCNCKARVTEGSTVIVDEGLKAGSR